MAKKGRRIGLIMKISIYQCKHQVSNLAALKGSQSWMKVIRLFKVSDYIFKKYYNNEANQVMD